jgi:membrane protein implicated in regulation of membrane protease activity
MRGMRPSRIIFAFLAGGIVTSFLLGRIDWALLLAIFLTFAVVLSMLRRVFHPAEIESRQEENI